MTFVNQTKAEVEIFWLDEAGERKPYGTLAAGERHAQHTFAGHVWLAATPEGRVLGVFEATDKPATAIIGESVGEQARQLIGRVGGQIGGRGQGRGGERSPDGKWEAFVRDHDLWLRDTGSKEEHRLTRGGSVEDTYSRERFREKPLAASADADRDSPPPAVAAAGGLVVAGLETRWSRSGPTPPPGTPSTWSSRRPRDQVQPKLQSMEYLKPGDEIPVRKPHLFDVESLKEVPVSDELFPNPYEVGNFRWAATRRASRSCTTSAGTRSCGSSRWTRGPARRRRSWTSTATRSSIIPASSSPSTSTTPARSIWMSERDGWNHLYLYDAKTGG